MIFLPEHERKVIERHVLEEIRMAFEERGKVPNILQVKLPKDDAGDAQDTLEMIFVVVEGVPYYESMQDVEMDGCPGQKLRILARV